MKGYYSPDLLKGASAELERMRERELEEHRAGMAWIKENIPERPASEGKIRTHFARIVVGGCPEKPRYEIMNFGLAIEAAKMGKKISRAGWNGKGQYVELGRNFAYTTPDCKNPACFHEDIGSAALVFVGTRGRQVGWLASQSDILADDWYIVE